MVRNRMRTASVIRIERIGLLRHFIQINVCETCLFSVGIRQPSQKMIEAAVLHHHHHNVINEVFSTGLEAITFLCLGKQLFSEQI
jgi:hypothetical protein